MDAFMTPATPGEVLEFWFGAGAERGRSHARWFRKDPVFDDAIRTRFLPTVERAANGGLDAWRGAPESALALIVVLDQFPRNLFRETARAFATDPVARAVARQVIDAGWDGAMRPVERQFVYLPLEHSESLADQDDCHRLMLQLAAFPETAGLHEWAEKHRVIIRRFGRFPHRNAALGRESTPDEIEFLTTPGSRF